MVLLLFCSCGKDESMDSSKGLVVEQQGTKDKVYKIPQFGIRNSA